MSTDTFHEDGYYKQALARVKAKFDVLYESLKEERCPFLLTLHTPERP